MENIYMPWVTRCSLKNIEIGNHIKPINCILIRILDPDNKYPPKVFYEELFNSIHIFSFLDLDKDDPDPRMESINNAQAKEIAKIIKNANENNYNIIVHCTMGLSRSGSVCEAIEAAFNYEYLHDGFLCPNLLVKSKILRFINTLLKEEELQDDEIFN